MVAWWTPGGLASKRRSWSWGTAVATEDLAVETAAGIGRPPRLEFRRPRSNLGGGRRSAARGLGGADRPRGEAFCRRGGASQLP
eukprot:8908006-Alexandrium_andersonii.AAC.1